MAPLRQTLGGRCGGPLTHSCYTTTWDTAPLTALAIATLTSNWLDEPGRRNAQALFPNMHGGRLSTDGVQYLLAKHLSTARQKCPSLERKRVSLHILRHNAAMESLLTGADCSVIALWLGHEPVETTLTYLHAHLALKEAALATLKPYDGGPGGRYRLDDLLLAFLNTL